MIPPAFRYHRPESLAEALELLSQGAPDARPLAGGHSLLPLLKMRLSQPAVLIDIKGVADLYGLRDEGDEMNIGAATTHREVAQSTVVRNGAPALAEAAGRIGDPQVRNRGTIGGSLAHADPAADYPAVLVALDAEAEIASVRGRRTVPVGDVLQGPLTTSLAPDELVVAVRVPRLADARMVYLKHPHPASGYAVVGVAAALTVDAGGRVRDCRIGITGVGPRAYRARESESMLTGQVPTDAAIREAALQVANGVEVLSDLYASREYRAHLAAVMTQRALQRLVA
jgi:carbon-monoxide dehydrogenase medium subunit